jgi:molybdate transport system permease protein
VKMGLEVDIEKQLESYALRVSFRANDEPLSILGASGAGKSMTLRCVAGLERPDRGRIALNERVLFDSERKIDLPARERRVGIVFQKYALLPNLTVEENIGFGLDHLPRAEREAKVQMYVGDAHLQGLEKRLPGQISGGEQQRVALARALAVDPEALLLDEPLSALDTYLRQQVERQLAQTLAARRGTTLFVTHNIDEAYRVGSEMLVLSRGEVVAFGRKRQIFDHPPTMGVAHLTGCKNLSEARAISPGVVEAIDWNCKLNVARGSEQGKHVGIRAHHITFQEDGAGSAEVNSFPCWVVSTSETPFRVTVYLRLNSSPGAGDGPHLQAELYREKYDRLKSRPMPWRVVLPQEKLFTVPD